MKIMNKLLILLMLTLPFAGFTGCSDDDDDSVSAKDAEGNYAGSIYLGKVVSSAAKVMDGAIITVTYVSDTEVTLSMNEDIPLPGDSGIALPITELPVNVSAPCGFAANGEITTKGSPTVPLDLTGSGTPMQVPVTLSGTFTNAGAASVVITITIPAITGVLPVAVPISVLFDGTKQQ